MSQIKYNEIKQIVKNSYNMDIFNISSYDFDKTIETIKKIYENKKMILYSENREIIEAFSLISLLDPTHSDYIIFYMDDFITMSRYNYKEIITGQIFKKILRREEDICVICYEGYKVYNGFLFCKKCGGKVCVDCHKKLEYNNCVICKTENTY